MPGTSKISRLSRDWGDGNEFRTVCRQPFHEKYDEQQHAEKAAVSEHLKTHQEAAPILKAIINEENAAVTALIKKYKELAPAAKDAKPDQVQKVQNSYDRTGHVQNKTFQNERVDADKAATVEIIANRKILSDALYKISEADAKAALVCQQRSHRS